MISLRRGEKMDEKGKKSRVKNSLMWLRGNLIWILIVFAAVYFFGVSFAYIPWELMMEAVRDSVSDGFFYIMEFYTSTVIAVLLLFLLCWLIRPNRYIWKSFLLKKRRAAAATEENDILAEFYGRSRNGFRMLGWGLLIGFLTNGFAIVCALLHGDIKLYFETSAGQIPILLFALFSVFIQSTSEELWCRGFLYERLHERYPLWVAVLVNGVLFGALHIFNEGVSVLSIVGIAICGVSYSLLRWYSGNLWIVMGAHTAWNFVQAFLFGLPNSGLVSEVSLFHLDASTGNSNLFYDFDFGVEGGLPALLVDLMLGVIVVILAVRSGRLKELKMKRAVTVKELNVLHAGEAGKSDNEH